MKKFLPFFFFLFLLIFSFFIFYSRLNVVSKHVTIGNTKIAVEVVSHVSDLTLGLSGRGSIPQNSGMLFVFPNSQKYGIWMKEMKFPLDIIWLSDDWHIVDIKENAQPGSYPEVFMPRALAHYVLEVNAGFAAQKGIVVGESALLSQ